MAVAVLEDVHVTDLLFALAGRTDAVNVAVFPTTICRVFLFKETPTEAMDSTDVQMAHAVAAMGTSGYCGLPRLM